MKNVNISNIDEISAAIDSPTGKDTGNNLLLVGDAARTYWDVSPLPSASADAAMMASDIMLGGGVGASGDILKRLIFNINSNTNGAVYLRDGIGGSAPDITTGTATVTVPATAITGALVHAGFTCTANQYRDKILYLVYTPTGHVGSIKIKRRIVSHAAFTGATTTVVFTTTHPWPVGGVPTSWGIEHASSKEIVPFSQGEGAFQLDFGVTSVNGGWILSVDSGVQASGQGKFTV